MTSDLSPTTDILRPVRLVRFVPTAARQGEDYRLAVVAGETFELVQSRSMPKIAGNMLNAAAPSAAERDTGQDWHKQQQHCAGKSRAGS